VAAPCEQFACIGFWQAAQDQVQWLAAIVAHETQGSYGLLVGFDEEQIRIDDTNADR
jgi:hypothetical protein